MQERGIALNDNRRKRVKGEARRDEEIQERGAIVMKAPSGMSRALQNKSKWDYRHKCVMWTVEWVLENGDKVYGNCQESRTITEAFDNAIGSRKMRKLQSRPSDAKSSTQIPDCGHSERQERKEIPLGSAAAAGSASSSPLHFYLHRPNLPSNVKCLIPLQPDAPVKEVIRNRVLIEFPTIFVLNVSEEHLSTPFVTEENYLKQQTEMPTTCGSETNELPESETKKPPVTFNDHPPELDAHEVPFGVDEQQVIEVLQRDLGT